MYFQSLLVDLVFRQPDVLTSGGANLSIPPDLLSASPCPIRLLDANTVTDYILYRIDNLSKNV